jgi:hypothetical protein
VATGVRQHIASTASSRLVIVIEEVLVRDRLKAVGRLMHAEERTIRGWADDGGWDEIAAELIYSTGAGLTVARQTTYLRYPTKEQGLAMTFVVEVPMANRDFEKPIIIVNEIDYVDESDPSTVRRRTTQRGRCPR